MRSDEVIPDIQDLLRLIGQYVVGHAQGSNIVIREQRALLQLVEFRKANGGTRYLLFAKRVTGNRRLRHKLSSFLSIAAILRAEPTGSPFFPARLRSPGNLFSGRRRQTGIDKIAVVRRLRVF